MLMFSRSPVKIPSFVKMVVSSLIPDLRENRLSMTHPFTTVAITGFSPANKLAAI